MMNVWLLGSISRSSRPAKKNKCIQVRQASAAAPRAAPAAPRLREPALPHTARPALPGQRAQPAGSAHRLPGRRREQTRGASSSTKSRGTGGREGERAGGPGGRRTQALALEPRSEGAPAAAHAGSPGWRCPTRRRLSLPAAAAGRRGRGAGLGRARRRRGAGSSAAEVVGRQRGEHLRMLGGAHGGRAGAQPR
jgi:hypothetical protein